jgi:hypothetical protein
MGLRRSLDLRSRMVFALGSVCLYTGVMVALLAKDLARHHSSIYNGLLFGLPSAAIALYFRAMRQAGNGNKGNA